MALDSHKIKSPSLSAGNAALGLTAINSGLFCSA